MVLISGAMVNNCGGLNGTVLADPSHPNGSGTTDTSAGGTTGSSAGGATGSTAGGTNTGGTATGGSSSGGTSAGSSTGAAADTWTNYGQAAFSGNGPAHCTSCHSAGANQPTLVTDADVRAHLQRSIVRVGNDSMPTGGMSAADKTRLLNWLNAGAPN